MTGRREETGEKQSQDPLEKCPYCGEDVAPDDRFCDSCGARISSPPVCSSCNTPWVPGAHFCEKCGSAYCAPALPGKENVVASAGGGRRDTKQGKSMPAASPAPEFVPTPTNNEITDPKRTGVPGRILSAIIYPVLTMFGRSRFRWDRIGLLLLIVGAVACVALYSFPLIFPQTGADAGQDTLHPLTTSPPILSVAATAAPTLAGQVPRSSVEAEPVSTPVPETTLSEITPQPTTQPTNPMLPGPTQTPPSNLNLVFEVVKDSVSGDITVRLAGGFGKSVMRSADIRVVHPDGTSTTSTIQPSKNIQEVTLPGTWVCDRVTVTANFYSGQTYTVYDQVLDFPKKM